MIRRFYVHNYRCLENFELPFGHQSSLLLIGKNGSGKSTVGAALELLQRIARGTNRVSDLVSEEDFSQGRTQVPMRFEIEAELKGETFRYAVAFESEEPHTLRVRDEQLRAGQKVIYERDETQDSLRGSGVRYPVAIEPSLILLPILQGKRITDPLTVFRSWLAGMLIIRPIPRLIRGDSSDETLQPNIEVSNLGAWFSGLLAHAPAAYSKIEAYIRQVMPDFLDIQNPATGGASRRLQVRFIRELKKWTVAFEKLSDGEKCFFICAIVLAAKSATGPLVCFWDEPDSHLAVSEVRQFVAALRQGLQAGSQFIATSHNPEAIRAFSDENTLHLTRRSHLEPTVLRSVESLRPDFTGDLVGALIREDLEP